MCAPTRSWVDDSRQPSQPWLTSSFFTLFHLLPFITFPPSTTILPPPLPPPSFFPSFFLSFFRSPYFSYFFALFVIVVIFSALFIVKGNWIKNNADGLSFTSVVSQKTLARNGCLLRRWQKPQISNFFLFFFCLFFNNYFAAENPKNFCQTDSNAKHCWTEDCKGHNQQQQQQNI